MVFITSAPSLKAAPGVEQSFPSKYRCTMLVGQGARMQRIPLSVTRTDVSRRLESKSWIAPWRFSSVVGPSTSARIVAVIRISPVAEICRRATGEKNAASLFAKKTITVSEGTGDEMEMELGTELGTELTTELGTGLDTGTEDGTLEGTGTTTGCGMQLTCGGFRLS